MASIPYAGDIIISRLLGVGTAAAHGISVYGGVVQFHAPSYDAARVQAESYARHVASDLWSTDDGESYSCVAQFRSM